MIEQGLIEDALDYAISQIKPTSTPGYPLIINYSTNFSAFEGEGILIREMARQRILKFLSLTMDDLDKLWDDSAAQLTMGLRDPIRIFLKREPHPERKLREGRYRMVAGLSVVDQIVERVLFSGWSERLKSEYPSLGTVIGLGFSDQHIELITDEYLANLELYGEATTYDVSGWDRSVMPWMFDAEHEIRWTMSNKLAAPRLELAQRAWIAVSCNCPYVLPSGHLYAKICPGLMPSGSYRTSSCNSLMRLYVSMRAGARYVMCNGDDAIEFGLDDPETRYSEMGFKIRDVERTSRDHFTFCSHSYNRTVDGWTASLDTWPKALYKFFAGPMDQEQLAAFLHETRYNDPDLRERVLRVVSTVRDRAAYNGPNEESQ